MTEPTSENKIDREYEDWHAPDNRPQSDQINHGRNFNNTPFRWGMIQEFERPDKFNSFKEDPELIIRTVDYLPQNSQEITNTVIRFRSGLDELTNDYGVEIAKASFVVFGQGKGRVVYVVTERIHGDELSRFKHPKEEAITLRKLVDYYSAKLKNGGDFIEDINTRQFVYGKPKNGNEDKPYLVDLDIFIDNFNRSNPNTETINSLLGELSSLLDKAIELERKTNESFDQVKSNIREAVRSLAPNIGDDETQEWVEHIMNLVK